jgi:hypothetical protein
MAPGDVHYWSVWGFAFGTVPSVAAFPVTGNPKDPDRVLAASNFEMHGHSDGGTVYTFMVRNTGGTNIPGYSLNIGFISE